MPSKTWTGTIIEMKRRRGKESHAGSVVTGKIERRDGKVVDFRGNLMKGIDLGMEVKFGFNPAIGLAEDIRPAHSRWPSEYQSQSR